MTTTAIAAADEPGRPRSPFGDPHTWLASLAEVAADRRAHPWKPEPTGALEGVTSAELDYWASRVDPGAFSGPTYHAGAN